MREGDLAGVRPIASADKTGVAVGMMRSGTVFQLQQSGPARFTGGAFGPEGAAVGLSAMLLAIVVIFVLARKKQAEAAVRA